MAESERLVKIEILGQEHAFYTAASDEDLKSILSMVRQLVDSNSGQPAGKMAVFACLNIASRYVKLRQEYESLKDDSEQRLQKLNDRIALTLGENTEQE